MTAAEAAEWLEVLRQEVEASTAEALKDGRHVEVQHHLEPQHAALMRALDALKRDPVQG